MQLKTFTVVEVVVTMYLSTGLLCHYIPEKKITPPNNKSEISPGSSEKIQICGNQLTDLIIKACDGIVGSFDEGLSKKGRVHSKITEECCDHWCPMDYIQSYCGQTPLFVTKKSLRRKLLGGLNIHRQSLETERKNLQKNEKRISSETEKKSQEVRNKKGNRKKKGKKGVKKKRSFKLKCAYKSFGHFLLKLERSDTNSTNISKRDNNINRSWPSIQVGTISPDIDKFGGRPTVVLKKS